MYFHFINYSKNNLKDPRKRFPFNGKIFLGSYYKENIAVEWHLFDKRLAAMFKIREGDLIFYIAIPFIVSLFLTFHFGFLTKILTKDRECSFCIYNWCFNFIPWGIPFFWSSKDPWWRKGITFHVDDFVLGRRELEKVLIEKDKIKVPFSEKIYDVDLQVDHEYRWRKRFPFLKKHQISYWCSIKEGIPFPGSGENYWNCGMDGLCGCGGYVSNLSEVRAKATARVVECVMENRIKNGGKNWEVCLKKSN